MARNSWEYKYGENEIDVLNNSVTGRTELYINGKLHDKKLTSKLKGRLDSGEEVNVRVGGAFRVKCSLQIDNRLVLPIE